MKMLCLILDSAIQREWFKSNDLADSAYQKIKVAMAEYKEYGNDRERVIDIDADFSKITIRLSSIRSVAVVEHDLASAQDFAFERAMLDEVFIKRLKEACAEPKP